MADTWLKQLDHPEASRRARAVAHIAASGNTRYLDPLLKRAAARGVEEEMLLCRFLRSAPPRLAARHARFLCDSSHEQIRRRAMMLIDDLPRAYRLQAFMAALNCPHPDVLARALGFVAQNQKYGLAGMAARFVRHENAKVSDVALSTLCHANSPAAVRALLPFLDDEDDALRVNALGALLQMKSFRAWKRCLPQLSHVSPDVRIAAARCIHHKANQRANIHLLTHLKTERDPRVIKTLFRYLSHMPDLAAVCYLLEIACDHQDPDIRRTADWTLNDISADLLIRASQSLLPHADEARTAVLLVKLGRSRRPQAGGLIASFIRDRNPGPVRQAAIEALGYLGQPARIPDIAPLIFSDDPMEAYIATLSTVQITRSLDDCPELFSLLTSENPEHEVLIQVVLQYMDDAVVWDYNSPALNGALQHCLASPVQNIRYHALKVVGKTHNAALVESVLASAQDKEDEAVRALAVTALKELLDGDVAILLGLLAGPDVSDERREALVGLLGQVSLNPESARAVLDAMAGTPPPFRVRPDDKNHQAIARRIFNSAPEQVRQGFQERRGDHAWRLVLGRAWLDALAAPASHADQRDWGLIFTNGEPALMRAALDTAVQNRAAWAVEAIVDRVHTAPPAERGALHGAVKQILEL